MATSPPGKMLLMRSRQVVWFLVKNSILISDNTIDIINIASIQNSVATPVVQTGKGSYNKR